MRKIIKRYLCIVAILSTMMGYGQICQEQDFGKAVQGIGTMFEELITRARSSDPLADRAAKVSALEVQRDILLKGISDMAQKCALEAEEAKKQNIIKLYPTALGTQGFQDMLRIGVLSDYEPKIINNFTFPDGDDGIRRTGTLYQFPGLTILYFTPNVSDDRYKVGIYYPLVPGQAPNTTNNNTTTNNSTTTIYIYDNTTQTTTNSLGQTIPVFFMSGDTTTSNSSTPSTTTITNPSLRTWYADSDGDGYHSYTQQKEFCSYPWKSSTKGVDCDDKDATKTTDCSGNLPLKGWFLDNDRDGYFAEVQTRTTKPTTPGNWTDVMTKGPDCNDEVASADNSVCVATPTPCTNKTVCSAGYSLVNCECVPDVPPNPCDEIKKALADAKFKEMLVNLKDSKKLDLNHETGTFQAKDGNYYPMEVFEGEPGVFVPSGSGPAQNINHVHTKQFIDAKGVVKRVFPMPSPTDIATIYTDYHFVRSMGTDPGNNYSGTINSLGYFQLRYTGQADNLSWDQLKAKRDLMDTYENGEIFKALAKEHDNMIGFLIFIRDTLKITDIALYQVDDTGAKKMELDANNQIKEIPCK